MHPSPGAFMVIALIVAAVAGISAALKLRAGATPPGDAGLPARPPWLQRCRDLVRHRAAAGRLVLELARSRRRVPARERLQRLRAAQSQPERALLPARPGPSLGTRPSRSRR